MTLSEATDFLNTKAGALLDLAQVYHDTGRSRDSNEATSRALALYEEKENRVAAHKVRERLAVLTRR